MSYLRFAAMIATSTAIMYGLMYLNTYQIDHVFYSQTRLWMALLMGAVMAVIMLGFMWSMYKNRAVNLAILAGAAVVFALYGLFAAAIRGQVISRPAVLTWMRRSFAAAFVALGAKLALTQR